MDRAEWLKGFQESPDAVQEYLLSGISGTNEDAAMTKLAYDNDAWERLMDVAWDVLFKKLPRQEFSARCKALAVNRKPEDVEKALLRWVILPLADVVSWDVETRLQELGVPLEEIQSVQRVSLRPVSYGAAIRRIAAMSRISLLNEDIIKKLRDVLISFLTGVRNDEQVIEFLVRSQAEGGLGFAPQQAKAFQEQMAAFLATTKVLSEQAYAEWFRNLQNTEAEDIEEAKRVTREAKSEELDTSGVRRNSEDPALDEAIDSAIVQLKDLALDEFMQKRLRNIVSTRLRDVRNAMQTKDILIRDKPIGGLGLDADASTKVAGIIEATYQAKHQLVADEERKRIEAVQSEQSKKIEERKARESAEHAEWYKQKVMSSTGDDAVAQIKEIMAGHAPSQAASGKPQSQESASKPSMQDVAVPARLTGLADELKNMDAASFRRQSKVPEQAAEKIYQKLETLKRENFERWTDGVEAWRSSPLQTQYLKLIAESFASAKPVAELVEEKRKTDPNMLTAEELGAIIALNSKIQY